MTNYYTGRMKCGEEYPLTYISEIDWSKCIGCGACVKACGQEVLTMVNTSSGYKAKLLAPVKCLGEGHCIQRCPTNSIKSEFIEVEDNGDNNLG